MLFGRGCAAEASKPVPIFKGHFGGKGYPLLGIFSQEWNYMILSAGSRIIGQVNVSEMIMHGKRDILLFGINNSSGLESY